MDTASQYQEIFISQIIEIEIHNAGTRQASHIDDRTLCLASSTYVHSRPIIPPDTHLKSYGQPI